jgi:4-hydroxy-4-methyl-2-oxoglutarate aldolase
MASDDREYSVTELQARWNKIRVANLYDTLDQMGYPNQCIDLGIRPLFPHQHLAGLAVTVRGGRDPRSPEEIKAAKDSEAMINMRDVLVPGVAVVVDGGGEPFTGKFGEMTSWNLKQSGAMGIVIDGMIRDSWGLEVIPDYTVCARGTSPVESSRRWRINAVNVPIAMPGTLSSQVPVFPGDWIVAEADGVMVVPQAIAMEALVRVEKIEAEEEGMRRDMAAGMSFDDAYKKWGRA